MGIKHINQELKRSKVFTKLASVSEELYWDIYLQEFDLLKEFDIIYVDKSSTDYGKLMIDFFQLNNGLISSCFYDDRLKFINEKVLQNNLNNNNTKIFTSFDIQLDTNVVSELDNMRRGKTFTKKHENDLKALTKRRKVHSTVSIGPYLSENYYNNGYELNDTILDVYYHFLFELNKNSCNSFKEALRDSKVQTKQFKEFYENELKNGFVFEMRNNMYKSIYLNLLKMIILNKSKLTINEKVYKMLKFQNDELCKYLLGEANIAVRFFEEKYKFGFFSKLQNPSKDRLISLIKNMTWDIFHLRNLEMTMSMMRYDDTDFVFPMLFSFDKNFNELRRSSGLRLFINHKFSYNFYPFYKEDIFYKYINLQKMKKMWSKKAKKRRMKNSSRVDFDSLISKYENEVIDVYFG